MSEQENGGMDFQVDFNLEDEFKPEPLIPNGVYHAAVTAVSWDSDNQVLLWQLTLGQNDGYCNDDETPIDGCQLFHRNYFPKPGDENERTKDGRMTKRQGKINMIKRFQDDMKVDINSPSQIREAIMNQEWIGVEVTVTTTISEYMGRFRNDVKKMVRA